MRLFRSNLHRALTVSWIATASTVVYAQVSVLTWHNDRARSGQNLQETILTPANVNSSTFGKLFTLSVDGKVDAQPLYVPLLILPNLGVHNVVYVMTEHDSVYAFDADNGTLLKRVSLLGASEVPSDDHGCSQVTPEIGITATPAIDLEAGPHGTMYVVAMSKDLSNKYHHRIHALDLTTLTDEIPPVEIAAAVSGSNPDTTFTAAVHKERPGLLIVNGVVYTSWGSHCDAGSYAGWVIGYNESTLALVNFLNLAPNGSEAGIWNAGAGPAADASGNIYLLTGNGTFDTNLNLEGLPSKGDYGNAFVKMSTSGVLAVTDYFTMSNTASESSGDVDLGSGGLMLLPPLNDSQGHPRSLAVGAGKDRNIYVLDQTNLGKFNSGSDNIYQQLTGVLPGGAWSSPAWFNGNLYYGDVGSPLKAFSFANGLFITTPVSHSSQSFPYPGTTPSVSANGTSNAIVWAAENSSPAVLHAYDATDLSKELYNTSQAANARDHFGSGNKFIVPTVVNGKVYVGTTSSVGVFGLFSQPLDFSVAVSPSSRTILAGSSTTYTIAMISTSSFNGLVTFAASGLPPGATATFNPPSVSGSGASTLTISTATNGGTGSFTISVTGTSGMLQHQASASIMINGMEGSPGSNLGVFRSGQWWLDADDDFTWNGPPDRMFHIGQAGDIPIIGDWDNTGVRRAGVFRNGQWWLDMNNDGVWDAQHDIVFWFGQAGDIPIVGDWDESGIQRIGVFRNGQWWVDINGDHQWDALHDAMFYFGQAGDMPLVADWDNTGRQRIGVFRQGQWWLDVDGDHNWTADHDQVFNYGEPGDVPVIGDWTHSGQTRIGVFRQSQWWLDMNGDFVWDAMNDKLVHFGISSDIPVVAP